VARAFDRKDPPAGRNIKQPPILLLLAKAWRMIDHCNCGEEYEQPI
jgi:hypothetical protein